MAISIERKMSELYDEFHNRGYEPFLLNKNGKETMDPEKAVTLGFTLKDENNLKSNPAYASISKKPREDHLTTTIWVDDEFIKSPEFQTFHSFLRPWVLTKVGKLEIKGQNKFKFDMQKRVKQQMDQEKDKIAEGYYPLGKKTSYSDNVPTVKIIIEHNRAIEEGEQRFRNVHRIFVENLSGERFLLPTTRPGLARVYARHIAEGGTPYDEKGRHVTTLVEEYTKMAGFVRATKSKQFNESTQRLINEGLNHYSSLRETLTRLTTHRGYTKYFESYTPVLNEETDEVSNLNELFVQETLDPRIESVMPILQRLSKNLQEMTEVDEFANWSQKIVEGGDGGEASEETDGDTPGDAGEGGAEDVSENLDQKKIANSQEVASVIAKSFGGEEGLTSDDIYSAIGEYKELLAEKGYDVNEDKVAQILMDKLNIQLDEKMDSTTASLAVPADDMLDEAPGAMSLKHNQNTEKSNLKAFDLDEGSGDAPIEQMTDEELADYLGVSVSFVKQDRKRAEQAARDKTDDVTEQEDLDANQKFDDAEFNKMNMAQQTAYMKKNPMPGDINLDKSALQGNKDAEKLFKPAQNKDGTYSFSKGMAHAIDTMQPSMSQAGRDINKAYYRDMPGQLRKEKAQNPEKFQKDYDSLDDAGKAEVDKNLAITDKQAKANYAQQQGELDKQMTGQGYSKYGYNYNDEPVVGRVKNAGAYIKDKFNEEDLEERVMPGQDPNVNRLTGKPNVPYNDPAPELQPVKVQSQRPEGGQYSKDYLQKAASGDGGRYLVSQDKAKQYLDTFHKEDVEEDLDANQKRVGQLGPTEKVKNNNIGKLVGASESVELDRIKTLSGIK